MITYEAELARPFGWQATKKILVVDDDPLFRRALGEELEYEGFQIVQVGSGAEALGRLDEGLDIDLALIDYRLPDETGLDLLTEIKRRQPRCRVILMTAYSQGDTREEAIRCGAYQYLDKLDDFSHIVHAVQSAFHFEDFDEVPPFG